ncbi:MAG TPA: glycosyltransferase family 39 protein [Thermoflexus sp.]|nr:glycosyltransferase family 39 protein [Thermoflexus sp.]
MGGSSLTVMTTEARRSKFILVRAAVGLAVTLTFWAALAMMPWDLFLFDEKHVLVQTSQHGWLEIARALMRDSHPPLYYWLVKGWMEMGGFDQPWAFRVFSLMLGLPALPLAFQVGRQWGGDRLGLALVAWLMLNPLYLFFLILIRMYGLVVTLGALLTFLWARLMRRPTTRVWVLWILTQGLLIFTHYYGLLLIGAQWLAVVIRRPRGWWRGVLASLPGVAAWGGWLTQALGGSLEHTVRTLTAIPVRPMPWEILGHLWANLLVGPLADGRLAVAVALAAGGLLVLALFSHPPQPARFPSDLALVALVPPGIGSLLALRWPFFAARYFAMSLIPLLTFVVALLLRSRWKRAFPFWLLPSLVGIVNFPMLATLVLGLEDLTIQKTIQLLSDSEVVLAQAPWHLIHTPDARSGEWPDPVQRALVIAQAPAFWFIGVTIYRGEWEGWLRELQATHLVDFQMEFPHSIPEYRASVFHLVRQVPAVRWTPLDVRWVNGIRFHDVGWVQESTEAGHSVQWRLRFSTDRPLEGRWTLFVHLVDEAGRLWANGDAEPDPPTDRWEPGRIYEIGRSLLIPRFVPPGRYQVNIGWYETGTTGFPRLPLAEGAGDTVRIGELIIQPQGRPWRMGTRAVGSVALEPPEVRVRPGPEGARITVAFWWQGRKPAAFAGWQVVWRGSGGTVPLQRLHSIPDGATASGWVYEVWTSPLIAGGRPALGWLEIRYAGQLLARRPLWIFPASVSWSYDWLFLNRLDP